LQADVPQASADTGPGRHLAAGRIIPGGWLLPTRSSALTVAVCLRCRTAGSGRATGARITPQSIVVNAGLDWPDMIDALLQPVSVGQNASATSGLAINVTGHCSGSWPAVRAQTGSDSACSTPRPALTCWLASKAASTGWSCRVAVATLEWIQLGLTRPPGPGPYGVTALAVSATSANQDAAARLICAIGVAAGAPAADWSFRLPLWPGTQ
jgi:hypothetical protein